MKSTHLLACACGLLLAAQAVAQDSDDREARRAELIQKYDANGDGQLDETERAKLREDRRAKILEEFDTDGDGQLGQEERQAAHAKSRERRRAKILEKFDANGDGQLDET
ncbi:MAG: EF-hand domain-containing protein [Planctomycetota bacterium]|jgi:Ca2+-binding EF-hand superfamily protein